MLGDYAYVFVICQFFFKIKFPAFRKTNRLSDSFDPDWAKILDPDQAPLFIEADSVQTVCKGYIISADIKIKQLLYSNLQIDISSFLVSIHFRHQLITFANNLDPDQARQNVGPDLDPNWLILW